MGSVLSARSFLQPDTAAPACGNCHSGSFSPLRSFSQLGLVVFAPDFCEFGTSMPVQSCLQPDSSLPALDAVTFESSLLLRSLVCAGPSLPMPDMAHVGLPMVLQKLSWAEAVLLACGLCRLELTVPACDFCLVGTLLFLRRLACLGVRLSIDTHARPDLFLSTTDFGHIPLLSLRCCSQVGSPPTAPGFSTFDSLLSALDFLHSGLLMSLQSAACLGLAASILDTASPEAIPSTRSLFRFGPLMLLVGAFAQKDGVWNVGESLFVMSAARPESGFLVSCCARYGSPILASDHASLELLSLIRSFCACASALLILGSGRLEVPSSVSDSGTAGVPVPLHQLARMGSALLLTSRIGLDFTLSLLDHAVVDSSASLQQLGCSESPSSVSRLALVGLPVPAFDCCHVALPASARSLSRLGLQSPTLQSTELGLPMSLRSWTQLEASPFALATSRADSQLPSPDRVNTGSAPSARSSCQLDSPPLSSQLARGDDMLSILDLLHPGTAFPPRNFAKLGTYVLISGRVRTGLSFLPCDQCNMASSALMRSMSRLDVRISLVEMAWIESSVSVRSSAKPGSSILLASWARCGTFLVLLDAAQLDLSLPLQSFACSASSPSALQCLHMEALVPARAPTWAGFSTLIAGITCPGLSFPLLDHAHLNSLMPLRGLACSGLIMPVTDSVSVDPAVLARQTCRRSSFLSACCASRSASAALALDFLELEPSPSLRNYARLELAVSVLSWLAAGLAFPSRPALHLGSSFAIYSSLQLGEFLLALDLAFLDSPLLLRSSAKLELTSLLLDIAQTEPLLLVRNKLQLGLPLLTAGSIRFGVTMPAFSFAETGLLLTLQQLIRPESSPPPMGHGRGSITPALDLSSFGFAMPLRNYHRSDSPLLFAGTACSDPASFVLDNVCFGSVTSFRSSVRFGAPTLLSDSVHIDLSLPVQQLAHAGFTWAQGLTRLCLSLSITSYATLDPLSPAQQSTRVSERQSVLGRARLGSFLPVPDLTVLSSSFSVRAMMHLFDYLSIYNHGIRCKGVTPDSSLSVRSMQIFDSSSSIFKSIRIEESLLAPDFLHTESMTSPHSPACVGPKPSAPDPLHLGLPLSLQGLVRSGFAAAVPGLASLGPSLPARCFQRHGPPMFALGLRLDSSALVLDFASLEVLLLPRSSA